MTYHNSTARAGGQTVQWFHVGAVVGCTTLLLAGCAHQSSSSEGTSARQPVTLMSLSQGGATVKSPATVTAESVTAMAKKGLAPAGLSAATEAPKSAEAQSPPKVSDRIVMPDVSEPFVQVQRSDQPAMLANTALLTAGFVVAWSSDHLDISWSAKTPRPLSVVVNGKVVASSLNETNHYNVTKPPQGSFYVEICPAAVAKRHGACLPDGEGPQEEPGFARSTDQGMAYGLLVNVGPPGQQDKILKRLRADYAQNAKTGTAPVPSESK